MCTTNLLKDSQIFAGQPYKSTSFFEPRYSLLPNLPSLPFLKHFSQACFNSFYCYNQLGTGLCILYLILCFCENRCKCLLKRNLLLEVYSFHHKLSTWGSETADRRPYVAREFIPCWNNFLNSYFSISIVFQ